MERSGRLDDDALAEEIELYGELVVAASEADGLLSQADLDRVLGLSGRDGPGGEQGAEGAGQDDGAGPA